MDVFGTRCNTVPEAQVIRNQFKEMVTKSGLDGSWKLRELRHTFASVMSDHGASTEFIADLLGRKNTVTAWSSTCISSSP